MDQNQQLATLAWIEDVLANTDAKKRIEAAVTANATMTNSIVKQLTALRAQLRENAYSKIYEARAAVGDDLLKLTQSLTTLIHFSSVAGEDTSAYVALLRSVSKVTQQLSFFGEEDSDGDGIRDDAENTSPELDLQIDDGNAPPADNAVVAPKDEVQDSSPTESPDIDPDSVQPDDAEQGEGEQPDNSEEEGGEDSGEEPAADEGDGSDEGQDAEMNDDGEIQQDGAEDGSDAETEFDNVVKNLHRGKKQKKEGEEEDGKKSFLEKIEDGEGEGDVAESSVLAGAHDFRFAYLGINEDKKSVVAVVGDKRYCYKPAASLFGGSIERLDKAIRKFMAENTGYSAVLQKINALVREKKLAISRADKLTTREVRDNVATEIDRAQLGAEAIPAGTPWRYNGVGIQRVSNQDVCLWFEIGSKEYAAIPNAKAMRDGEDIDDFSDRIHGRLKTLSYDDGLTFLIGLVKRKVIKVIYVGKLQ
jgi:hypothetical protein